MEQLCDYGCGQKAMHQFKTTGKWCCHPRHVKCPAIREKNSKVNSVMRGSGTRIIGRNQCQFCKVWIGKIVHKKHESACYMNPEHQKDCPVCGDPVKDINATTCSYACSNTYYRSGINHPNHNDSGYRIICFHYHEKKCVVCDERNIVEVHHYDLDKQNNDPRNLVPLCSTHHKYMHSKFKHLVSNRVDEFVEVFTEKTNGNC